MAAGARSGDRSTISIQPISSGLSRRLLEHLLGFAFQVGEPLAIEVNRHRLHIAFALASVAVAPGTIRVAFG